MSDDARERPVDICKCPDCDVERADYEGPMGQWLPNCPHCGSASDPVLLVSDDARDRWAALRESVAEHRLVDSDPVAALLDERDQAIALLRERVEAFDAIEPKAQDGSWLARARAFLAALSDEENP